MNNDLGQFSEERLKELVTGDVCGKKYYTFDEVLALARIALAAKQAKPVAYMYRDNLHSDARFSLTSQIDNWSSEEISEYEITEIPLYTTPQPAHTEQDGWIKCSERMPDSKNDVQLFCSDTREQFVGFHRGNGMFQFFNMNDVIGECEPTHWMPLPAAPKPESE